MIRRHRTKPNSDATDGRTGLLEASRGSSRSHSAVYDWLGEIFPSSALGGLVFVKRYGASDKATLRITHGLVCETVHTTRQPTSFKCADYLILSTLPITQLPIHKR